MTSILQAVKSATVTTNPDGTDTISVTVQRGTINWAALLQAIIAAIPSILAIIAAFSTPTPVPTPTPKMPTPLNIGR